MTSTSSYAIDICKLPEVVREKLAQLDLELTEGDITEKGYEKKRQQLIEPFLKKTSKKESNKKDDKVQKHRRRTTRTETRYHSEIRQEAVQQALSNLENKNNKKEEHQHNNNNNNFLLLPTQQHNSKTDSFISFRQRIGSRNSRKLQGTQTSGLFIFLNLIKILGLVKG
uniref:DMAP1-binding domain-containing protein n=1 Tax=Meloidogyne floridensis TaxID=298350 RepID=A0A915NHW1_9BILA